MTQVRIICVSYVSLIAKHTSSLSSHISAAPPPNPEVQAVQEPEDDDVVVMSMSMDEGDDGEMPRKSCAQKRAIVTSPSEKDEHPSRRAKYEVSVP